MQVKHFYLLLLAVIWMGCTPDDDHVPSNQPTPPDDVENIVDVAVSTYNGVASVLSDSNELVAYLNKRFLNSTKELTPDAHVVLLDESSVAQIVNDAERMAIISSLWRNNRAFVFVAPGANALNMIAQLRAEMLGMTHAALPQSVVDSYADVHLYITKADGNEMVYNNISRQRKLRTSTVSTTDSENAEANITTSDVQYDVVYSPTDYEIGRIAERASEWCNTHADPAVAHKNMMFRSSTDDPYAGNRIVRTMYTVVAVDHGICYDYYWCTLDEVPQATTTEAMVRIDAAAGYSETIESDIYDLFLTQEFNATSTYLANYLIHEHLSYNWRYSGGYYYGPTVDINLGGAEDDSFSFYDNTDIYEPVPVPTADSYTVTHNPATTSFNGGVIGGGSLSSSGLSGSVSGSFGFGYTLPSTSVTMPQKEMPLFYTPNHNAITWRYQTDWELHDVHWGTNPDFNAPPQITYSDCITQQAVSFGVRDSKLLEDSPVYVDYNINFKTYHELARAEIESQNIIHKDCGDHYKELVSHCYTFPRQQMPIVARYFKDYNPICFYTNGNADGATGWAQLETMLLDNSYYATFDSDAEIRSATEQGLDKVAEEAWREAMKSIIASYPGITTSYDYIVALAYDVDKHLKVGLYIHDGVWEIIEDVDAKKEELIKEASTNDESAEEDSTAQK